MFDIGFWELTTIAVIALLVIGPDKLPGVARTAGKWVGRARRFVNDVKTDIDRELKQEEIRKALADDVGLDEIKQIMNADNFTIDADDTPSYQVSAIDDPEAYNKKIMDEERARQEAADEEHDRLLDEELSGITDHSDAAEDEPQYDTDRLDTSSPLDGTTSDAVSDTKPSSKNS
ncbi:MAG: Sec-independent protein translocase protein TatB [Gammaproteobacteria bacterium]|nr:Sec-independent protein translocase protein TatB [Gammaproteobacteria bacterium]MCW8988695.1 Sec-independent protein translocase protein TatB [Gammaproteobacteria bacterium]MCW9031607.1 Sec-independent protein translocase protein TatB [Gammaproteobacteria bacterium]